jgi:hypothetical protein
MSVAISTGVPTIPGQYLECIGQGNIVSDSQYLDMTGMDSSIDKWYLLLMKIINPTAGIADYYVYFDTDYTNSNYYSQYIAADDTTHNSARLNTPNFAGLSTLQNMITRMDITQDVANYTRAISHSNRYAPNVQSMLLRNIAHNVSGTFTKIRIYASVANGIGAGSKFYLYRYKGLI